MKNSNKIRKKIGMVVMILGCCLHGLCALPNMVINVKIMRKSGKNEEKKQRHHVYLLLMLRYSLHGLCAFPNMVINVNIIRKSGKNRKNEETDVDHCQQCTSVTHLDQAIS